MHVGAVLYYITLVIYQQCFFSIVFAEQAKLPLT